MHRRIDAETSDRIDIASDPRKLIDARRISVLAMRIRFRHSDQSAIMQSRVGKNRYFRRFALESMARRPTASGRSITNAANSSCLFGCRVLAAPLSECAAYRISSDSERRAGVVRATAEYARGHRYRASPRAAEDPPAYRSTGAPRGNLPHTKLYIPRCGRL